MFKKDIVDSPQNESLLYERLFYKASFMKHHFAKDHFMKHLRSACPESSFLMNAFDFGICEFQLFYLASHRFRERVGLVIGSRSLGNSTSKVVYQQKNICVSAKKK